MHPRARIPEPPITILEAGDRGWVVRRDPPQPPIRIPDVGVAAAGVPHYPARDGVRAGAPAMKAPPPARGAGLTAIIPPINWRGKGDEGQAARLPSPAASRWSGGRGPKEYPARGASGSPGT